MSSTQNHRFDTKKKAKETFSLPSFSQRMKRTRTNEKRSYTNKNRQTGNLPIKLINHHLFFIFKITLMVRKKKLLNVKFNLTRGARQNSKSFEL